MTTPWWQSAVIYQIYPRSFLDTDGDGVGDLEGVRRRLDYLSWLGVDGLWLSPFFRSPMADYGYDVSDYRDVDPLFGTLADFDRLLAEAHQRDLKVLIDWVPNHTSEQHPWFVESRSSKDNPKRDWYVWRDRPNNWTAVFGGDAWDYDERTGQWYLHLFLPQQPDLNWRNPEVAAALRDTLRFWLDRGVDGFRIDAVHYLAKHPDLLDNPPNPRAKADTPEFHRQLRIHDQHHPDIHPMLRAIRRLVDQYPGDRLLVGEVFSAKSSDILPYHGQGDELQLAFNFPLLFAPWDAAKWRQRLTEILEEWEPAAAWPTWVLSNHDLPRAATRYGSEARARAAALALLTLRGTPFLYAGEELGLADATVPPERQRDPAGRDGCRAPLPWDRSPSHGWPTAAPWLPWPPDPSGHSVEAEQANPHSTLHLYRRLLQTRKQSPALRLGRITLLDSPAGTLLYERALDGERYRVLVNFTSEPTAVPLAEPWQVVIASDAQGEGAAYDGWVRGDCALLLRGVRG